LNIDGLLEKYKGIHPGKILQRELKKRNLEQALFALSLKVDPQTFDAFIQEKSSLTPELYQKIDQVLGFEEGTMYSLYEYYEIQKIKLENGRCPDLSILRKILFLDTDISKIDWEQHWKYVIKRVFERGNFQEKEEIIRFYGEEKVKGIVGSADANYRLELPSNRREVR